ncbi:uncharacterized protein LOC141649514 [Silene latifolia]|uniref:uncharacterized protein LOC141649514 n=1 Tax=Silene latifolia TaxID=37657 RepID=UPI003D76E91B
MGIIQANVCFLCGCNAEIVEHLFFLCPFSSRCLELVAAWLKISLPDQGVIEWWVQQRARSLLLKQVLAVALASLIYHVWMSRNNCQVEGPVVNGGLGIIDSRLWIIAAIGKLVWWLATKKDILWIKWVDQVYLKGRDWYTYQPSLSSSWAWRQICAVKEKLKVGYTAGKWTGSNAEYTISSGYDWLHQENWPKVQWHNIVWNRLNTPKHCFNAWLIQQGRLLTLDRLCRMGITDQKTCYLCGIHPEDHDHIFNQCIFTQQCHDRTLNWLQIQVSGNGNAQDMMRNRRISAFRRKLLSSLMVAL